ncbi:hypothetical protein B484DRAFT_282337, partial [Ochromonadaceae sp. CCMP2298]
MARENGCSTLTSFGRVFWLRALVVASLLVVAAVIGLSSYNILRDSELNNADSVYESVSVAALVNTQNSFKRATKGATMLAGSYSAAWPSESAWPNAYLGGFADSVAQLAELSSVSHFSFAPIVRPDQVAAWETFAFNLWDSDPDMPPFRSFISPTVRGIWNFNPTIPPPGSIFLDDLTGNTIWGNTQNILAPVTQALDTNILGQNGFPDPVVGPLVEKVHLCPTGKDIAAARTECTAVVTPLSLPLPNPLVPNPSVTTGYMTLIVSPIAIVGDDGATNSVGVVTAILDWSELLADTVPSFVGEMDIVVEADGLLGGPPVVFTFAFEKGSTTFKGNGDLHDTRYSSKKKSAELYLPAIIGIAESSQYTISFYPRKAFYDEYKSDNPIFFAVGGVSLIALVSLIFLLYDFAVSRQSERQQVVLDTKRRYVRFISHEIRTPLNTVRLGLKLFDLELIACLKMLKVKSPAEVVQLMTKTIENWIQLTDDALSNTEAAVDVLNDLLNYDKV